MEYGEADGVKDWVGGTEVTQQHDEEPIYRQCTSQYRMMHWCELKVQMVQVPVICQLVEVCGPVLVIME